jgi:putative ABC transport system permease protein
MLAPGTKQSADAFAAAHRTDVPRPLFLQTTARTTAGFQSNRATSQIALIIASVFAFIASSFIIATGMTTGVTERVRELAVLRCIGATRRQLAAAQVFSGVVVGAIGACVGLPIGIGGSAWLVSHYPQQLPGGFALSWPGVTVAALGSVSAGVIGAAWSAWNAARVSPLEGLAARSRAPRTGTVAIMFAVGVVLVTVHASIVAVRPGQPDSFFWYYVPIGIPAMLSGYFLLGTPVTAAIARFVSPLLSLALRLPPRLLERTLAQTPFRHGFTAASMMVGVAMLISIWTNGRSIMEHWLERMQFPDAFVTGLSIRPDTADRVRKLPGVAEACAVTRQTVGTDAFGIKGITKYKTTFFAFEPEPFFHMSRVEWLQGDPETAIPRLKAGGAVIVAKEFLVTRKIGLGAKINLIDDKDQPHQFEVVGVVTNPGLDVASRFFDIGENYLDQAVNSVFGSRDDLIKYFGNDSISLIQINFKPGADPKATYNSIRNLPGAGIFAGSTAVWLKDYLRTMIGGSLRLFSMVAIGAMIIASFGVANIIIAGVQARAFQFGVLRAVGAHRWLLGRLVIGEALVIAVSACLLGTGLGLQAAWGGQTVTSASIGIEFGFHPPVLQVGWAWLAVATVTLAAAAPTAWSLVRKQPRQLLGVTRG